MAKNTDRERLEAAKRYVAADRSDPFALGRVMLHMSKRHGICGFTNEGKDAFYSADEFTEIRHLPDGREYSATVYKNLVRP